ncbi:type VI secretion system protein ImpA [Luteibacter jiangsuensis]|uniref:Type VI secretion system protein ImpA n=1 Tax=Luteibacter jiangsuensis TaxID=637577 RepID=A0ABT9SYX4_9GAMM|nr:type VI secretion system protein TssA [Luteibacter jiangsuensis]MDQ0010205.1 type VI secretion system protein ImpA [Luteibacter jiangsuensis]
MDITEALLSPLDADAPCGPNLEYDALFLTLESLATATPERAVGHTVRQAEEPDWRDVAQHAETVAQRTRDLRVAVHLASAWLKTGGIPAWSEGMGLVRGLLERYWDDVHPRLDDGDPLERINALAALSSTDGMLAHLRRAPILHAERVGSFSLRDLRVLNGTLKPEGGDNPAVSQEHVDLVARQADVEELRRVHAGIATALEHAHAIGRTFDERTPGRGPDMDALLRDLRDLHAFLQSLAGSRLPAVAVDAGDDGASPAGGTDASRTSNGTSRGPISGPDDVVRLLDEICAWYAIHEPSSPVPPLLRRASQLVGLSFAELLKAIAPGGLSEFQVLAGDSDS